MVASNFDGHGGYRTLKYEGQVPTRPYNCCYSRVFQASICIATYGMSVPFLHTESTNYLPPVSNWKDHNSNGSIKWTREEGICVKECVE